MHPLEIFKTIGLLAVFLTLAETASFAQNLYTSRGYWEESNKRSYRTIKQKVEKGDSLSTEETSYAKDYETYLANYFGRMSEEEKQRYEEMKDRWNGELAKSEETPKPKPAVEEFEFRTWDRISNYLYGAYYGTSLVVIGEIDNPAAVGIPLIVGGLCVLSPVFNEKKYEGITRATIRASNTGKLFGLGYGWALALAVAGSDNSDNTGKIGMGLSTISSIALGEVAFRTQKRKNISEGRVEVMRHYGFLGPVVGVSLLIAAQSDNANLAGIGLLAGGITGLAIGNKVSKGYDYSKGDMGAVGSLSIIAYGLGLAVVAQALENSESSALILIPAASAIAGTLIGQRSVKNLHLTNKQGSVIKLASFGSSLIGLGVMAIAEVDSPGALIGVTSLAALIGHQGVLSKFKRANLLKNLKGENPSANKYALSMNVKPENYFINKQIPFSQTFNARMPLNPIVNFTLKFK